MKITYSYVHAVPAFLFLNPFKGFFSGTSRWWSPLMPRQNSRRRGLGIPAPRCAKRVGIWKNQIDILCVFHSGCTTAAWNLFLFFQRGHIYIYIYSKDFSACYVGLTEGNCLEFYLWHGSIYFQRVSLESRIRSNPGTTLNLRLLNQYEMLWIA